MCDQIQNRLSDAAFETFDATMFINRRYNVIAEMGKRGSGVAIIPTSSRVFRNKDIYYPFRFDSNFWYLTGFEEPDAVLVLLINDTPKSILFCSEKNPVDDLWDGYRCGAKAAITLFGFDAAYHLNDLERLFCQYLSTAQTVWHAIGQNPDWDQRICSWMGRAYIHFRQKDNKDPKAIVDWRPLVALMRRKKSDVEIDLMQRAADVSAMAHTRAMLACKPGLYEYQLHAELQSAFLEAGGYSAAYPPIVACGRNACVLHYTKNNTILRNGDLVLIDSGCEVSGYASDITRTFPVNGCFSGPQRDLYTIVLDAQEAAIAAIYPGATFQSVHNVALNRLIEGMIDLKLCSGTRESVIQNGSYRKFYMHGTSHWIGLDVHDTGLYYENDQSVFLEAGMALTIEPGLYIRPSDDIPQYFHDIGVRVEDNVIITDSGCTIITSTVPKTIDGIEGLMLDRSW